MSKNRNKMRSGVAIAAMHRNSAGPMRHRLALRGNARSKAEAEVLSEYEAEMAVERYPEDRYESYDQEY
jgi:hypothetical protein